MAELGIITGREVKTNRDGDSQRTLLQVKIIDDDDVRTVELFTMSGEDVNPADDCRVFVFDIFKGYKLGIAVSDDLTPEVDPGEKEFYSTDSPVTAKKCKIKLGIDTITLDADGGAKLEIKKSGDEIVVNSGTDYAVAFEELKTEFNKLKDDYNSHTHNYNPGPGAATPTTATSAVNTSNIDNVKVDEVRLP